MATGPLVPIVRHQRRHLPVRADGGLRLGVVADTHGAPHPRAADHLRALAPDAILHAGDVGSRAVLDGLAEIAPLFAVRGNIDPPEGLAPDAVTLSIGDGGAPRLSLLLLHVGVAGPRIRADAAKLARAEGAHAVVCGHSHVPLIAQDRGLLAFNPGSIGPRRFQLPIVFGVIELSGRGLDAWHVDAETGARWSPPRVVS